MYLKNYDIIKLNGGFRLVNKNDPDYKHDTIDKGLFKPGDIFRVGYTGWLEHIGNTVDNASNRVEDYKEAEELLKQIKENAS